MMANFYHDIIGMLDTYSLPLEEETPNIKTHVRVINTGQWVKRKSFRHFSFYIIEKDDLNALTINAGFNYKKDRGFAVLVKPEDTPEGKPYWTVETKYE